MTVFKDSQSLTWKKTELLTMNMEWHVVFQMEAGKTKLPVGAYTMSHADGFGLLCKVAGEKKYADHYSSGLLP